MIKVILSLLLGYLLGSLNFAIVYSKLRGDDIRNHGSKNAGATNVLRTYGKIPALIVFLLDISKGIIAVLLTSLVFDGELFRCSAALGAILGHNFPLYYKFKGGKGVATSFAVLIVLSPKIALFALCIFIVTAFFSRYVSLSSVCACIGAIVFSYISGGFDTLFFFCLIIGSLCIYRHRTNIKRLIEGTENKLGSKK